MESVNTSATCITQKRNTRRTEKGKEEESDSTHLEEHQKEKVSGVRELSQSFKLSLLDENDTVDGYIDTQVCEVCNTGCYWREVLTAFTFVPLD